MFILMSLPLLGKTHFEMVSSFNILYNGAISGKTLIYHFTLNSNHLDLSEGVRISWHHCRDAGLAILYTAIKVCAMLSFSSFFFSILLIWWRISLAHSMAFLWLRCIFGWNNIEVWIALQEEEEVISHGKIEIQMIGIVL